MTKSKRTSSSQKESGKVPFDSILRYVGGTGRYQIRVLIFMTGSFVVISMVSTLPLFIAYKQKYLCRWNSSIMDPVPGNGSLIMGKCHVYRNKSSRLKVKCIEWDFDTTVFKSTIRSKYQLACGREYMAEMSSTLFFLGVAFGSVFFGVLSDRYGRILGITLSASQLLICGLAAAISLNYTQFVVSRYFAGVANGGLAISSFVMMAEVTEKKYRMIFILIVDSGFTLGDLLGTLVAYYIRDCFWLQVIAVMPAVLVCTFPIFVSESPRWLYTGGLMKRAEKVLQFVARCNRRQLTDLQGKMLRARCPSSSDTENVTVRRTPRLSIAEHTTHDRLRFNMLKRKDLGMWQTILRIVRQKEMHRMVMKTWYCWFAISMGYYYVLYSVTYVSGNDVFLHLLYLGICEILARFLTGYSNARWGRIPTIGVGLISGGLIFLASAYVVIRDGTGSTSFLVLSVINIFFYCPAFTTVVGYSTEIFPTVIRNTSVGVGSMWARIGCMLVPPILFLSTTRPVLTLFIIGFITYVAGGMAFFLPETKNRDTLEHIEDILIWKEEDSFFHGVSDTQQ